MRDEIGTYTQQGVQPFGVNPASVESHRKYVDKFKFPFPLLSDPDRAAIGGFGALKPGGKGVQRSVVLIARDGKVAFARRGAPGPDESLVSLSG